MTLLETAHDMLQKVFSSGQYTSDSTTPILPTSSGDLIGWFIFEAGPVLAVSQFLSTVQPC